jgi:putative ABC transport system permease protein
VVAGTTVLAGMGVLVMVTLSLRGDGALATAIGLVFGVSLGVAVLGPVLTAGPAWALSALLAVFPVTGHLAAANTRANTRRLAGAVAPLVLGIGFTGAGLFTEATATQAAAQQATAGTLADYAVSGPLLPPDLVGRVQQLPGVEAVTGVASTTVVAYSQLAGETESDLHPAQGLGGEAVGRALDLDVRDGDLQNLHGETVALGQDRAAQLEVDVGDRLPLSLGDGTHVSLEVAAVYARDQGFPDITLPRDLVLEHTTTGLDDLVFVRVAAEADRGRVEAKLKQLTADLPAAVVLDRDELRSARSEAADSDTWVSYLLIALLVAFLVVTVTNTLVIATAERSRELALLRLLGFGRGRVLQMIAAETLVLAVTAILFGTVAAASTLVPISLTLTGQPIPFTPARTCAAIVGSVVALTLATTLVTAGLSLRRRPVEVISVRT